MGEELFDELVEYVKHTERDGCPLVGYPDIRQALGETKWFLPIGRLLDSRVEWLQATGQVAQADSQTLLPKTYVAESVEPVAHRAMEAIGLNR